MFDTITDISNSMIGISILTIAGTAIFCHFTKSTIIQKVIQCLGFALWVSFWIGFIFVRNIMEFVFHIAIILFVVIAIIGAFIWFIRYIISELPPHSNQSDPRSQCEHCAHYEDCMRFSECPRT